MKHLFIFIAACLFLSCGQSSDKTGTGTKAEKIAQNFLNAYLHLDFDEALPLCGLALQADLELSAQRFYSLSPDIQELLKKDLEVYQYTINTIDFNPPKDSAFVAYTLFTPEAVDGIPSQLTVALEEQEWKVVKLL